MSYLLVSTENVKICTLPKWVKYLIKRQPFAISFPKKFAEAAIAICIIAEVALLTAYFLFSRFSFPFSLVVFGSVFLCIFLAITVSLYAFRVVIIRIDCYECQFGFFIVAHEKNHLIFNLTSEGETTVANKTWNENRKLLESLLLKNPKICEKCLFNDLV